MTQTVHHLQVMEELQNLFSSPSFFSSSPSFFKREWRKNHQMYHIIKITSEDRMKSFQLCSNSRYLIAPGNSNMRLLIQQRTKIKKNYPYSFMYLNFRKLCYVLRFNHKCEMYIITVESKFCLDSLISLIANEDINLFIFHYFLSISKSSVAHIIRLSHPSFCHQCLLMLSTDDDKYA